MRDKSPICTFQEFRDILIETTAIYKSEYIKYIESCQLNDFMSSLPISIMMMDTFFRYFKIMLKNDSYFGIIFDEQESFAKGMQQAINGYISSRINGDLSIKVACEPNSWKTYYNYNGVVIEATHDYGSVQLDDSYNEHMKKLKRN